MISDPDLVVTACILAALTSLLLSVSKPVTESWQLWFGLLFVIVRRRWKRRGVAAAPLWAFASTFGIAIDILRSVVLRVGLVRYYGLKTGLTWSDVQLQPLKGLDGAAHLIVVVPGTWYNPLTVERGNLHEIVTAIWKAEPQAQIVLARWPGWNKQSARARSAEALASRIKSHVSDRAIRVSFVGHSHGGTVAAAAAAQLDSSMLGSIVTLGSPLIRESPAGVTPRAGKMAVLPIAALVVILNALLSFGLTTFLHRPFPGLASLELILLFIGVWAFFFLVLVGGSLFVLSRTFKNRAPSIKYISGSKITAIYAVEDVLMKGLIASELLRRSFDAVVRRVERATRKNYEPRSFLRMHAVSALQFSLCLLSPLLMFFVLPQNVTREFAYVVVLVGTIAISALVTHLIPNPYFEWMAAGISEMFVALIRGFFALSRLALCGVPVDSIGYRVFVIAKVGLDGEIVRPIETGYSTMSAHSKMLQHPAVCKAVVETISSAASRPSTAKSPPLLSNA